MDVEIRVSLLICGECHAPLILVNRTVHAEAVTYSGSPDKPMITPHTGECSQRRQK